MRRGLLFACLVSLALPVATENSLAEEPSSKEPVDIGSQLELFVDDYLIDSMDAVRLKLHEPRSAGEILTSEIS